MQGKMQSFTVTTALVFYAIILGQTPLIETASTSWSETPSTDESRDFDVNDSRTTEFGYYPTENGNTPSTTISYYNDPWGVPTNATTTSKEPDYDRRRRPTTYGFGRTTTYGYGRSTTSGYGRTTTSSNDRRNTFSYGRTTISNNGNDWDIDINGQNDGTSTMFNETRWGGSVGGKADNRSNAWDATTQVSTFDFTNAAFINETWNNTAKNLTSLEIREVTLYVLPNGTAIYGFTNGTFVDSSSTAIHFPNGTVTASFPDGTSVNTTATTFLNGTTTFLFTNGTTLNSSEIFSLANGTKMSYVEEVLVMSYYPGTEEGDPRGMTTTMTRGFTTRMPRRTTTTTTTTSAPSSSDDDDGGRRPIRRKGAIPKPAPRPENNEDETTETPNGNRRQPGNWFG